MTAAPRPRLEGRRILITGGASGIGLETTKIFIREGAQVVILDRNGEAAEAAAKETGAGAVQCDVIDEGSVNNAVKAAVAHMNGLDGIVNAAGLTALDKFVETDYETWKRVIAVSVHGTFLVSKAAVPELRRAQGPTIVNIASAVALLPTTSSVSYAAAKGGVLVMSKSMAMELAPHIRVNAVCPGATDTPMLREFLGGNKVTTVSTDTYPLKRIGVPEDIANGILYLTSAESSFVTGIALPIDGGRTLH